MKRGEIMFSIILLHNYHTHYIGLNQIAQIFNPHYEQYLSFNGYDKIAR